MDEENDGIVIANLEDLPKIKGKSPSPQACPAIGEFIGDKRKTTDWLGLALVLTFASIELIVLLKGVFSVGSFDDIITLLDKVKDQWGTILGFVLGYYFANRDNEDSQP
ncbi:MAG: hypothetical protein ACYC2T_12930 [Bacillota bacterium]